MVEMFRDWFRSKYDQWSQGKYGWDASQVAFAKHLGINQKSVNEYLNGEAIPTHMRVIEKLFRIYGREIYDVLGIELSEEERVISYIRQLSPEEKEKFINEIKSRPDYEVYDLGQGKIDPPPE